MYLPLYWVLGESLVALFVGFIRGMDNGASLTLRITVEHIVMGHVATRRGTGNSFFTY